MNFTKILTFAIIAMFLLIGTSGAVTTIPAGYVSSYNLNSANTIYKLSGNVTANSTAFQVGASNITLDLMGYIVEFADKTTGYGFYSNSKYAPHIKNGSIICQNLTSSTAYPIYAYKSGYGSYEDLYLYSNKSSALYTRDTINNTFSDIDAVGNNIYGLYSLNASYNDYENCNFDSTAFIGGYISTNSNYNEFDYCTFESVTDPAFRVSGSIYNDFNRCSMESTSDYGGYLYSGANYNDFDFSNFTSYSSTGLMITTSSNYNTVSNSNTTSTSEYGSRISSSNHNAFENVSSISISNYGGYIVTNATNNHFTNSLFGSDSGIGLYLYTTANSNTFINNTFRSTSAWGFSVRGCTNNTFDGNTIQSNIDHAPVSNRHFAAVGDSITSGGAGGVVPYGAWCLNLSTLLGETRTLSNQGNSGETSAEGRLRFTQVMDVYNPDYMFILFGRNDISASVPQQDIIDNILEMAAIAKANGTIPYLLTVPPSQNTDYATQLFNQNLTSQATTLGYKTVDVYDAVDLVPNNRQYDGYNATNFVDTVHPNTVGNTLIATKIYAAVYENEIKRKNGLYLGYTSAWNGTWWNIVGPGPDDNWDYIGDEIEVTVS